MKSRPCDLETFDPRQITFDILSRGLVDAPGKRTEMIQDCGSRSGKINPPANGPKLATSMKYKEVG